MNPVIVPIPHIDAPLHTHMHTHWFPLQGTGLLVWAAAGYILSSHTFTPNLHLPLHLLKGDSIFKPRGLQLRGKRADESLSVCMLQHIASHYNLQSRTVRKFTVINKSAKPHIAQQQVCATIKRQYLGAGGKYGHRFIKWCDLRVPPSESHTSNTVVTPLALHITTMERSYVDHDTTHGSWRVLKHYLVLIPA